MTANAPDLADRLQAARDAYQAELRAKRGPDYQPPHVPQHAPIFRAFEVAHCAEFKPEIEGERNQIVLVKGASIDEVRRDPRYVADFWTLYGRQQDGIAQAIGDFKTEAQARDVLGGITGDRNYDQRPLRETMLAAEASEMELRKRDAQSPFLSERITVDMDGDEFYNITAAQFRAEQAQKQAVFARHGITDSDPRTMPIQDLPTWRRAVEEAEQDRPNEQLLGSHVLKI